MQNRLTYFLMLNLQKRKAKNLLSVAICDAAYAERQGDGLFLSDPSLGDALGNWIRKCIAVCARAAGYRGDGDCAADAASQRKLG